MREARDRRTSNYVCIGSQADMAGPDIFEIEHNAPNVRSYVLRVETEFGAHLQHGRVFGQHIAIHASQTLFFRVIDDTPHVEQPPWNDRERTIKRRGQRDYSNVPQLTG